MVKFSSKMWLLPFSLVSHIPTIDDLFLHNSSTCLSQLVPGLHDQMCILHPSSILHLIHSICEVFVLYLSLFMHLFLRHLPFSPHAFLFLFLTFLLHEKVFLVVGRFESSESLLPASLLVLSSLVVRTLSPSQAA